MVSTFLKSEPRLPNLAASCDWWQRFPTWAGTPEACEWFTVKPSLMNCRMISHPHNLVRCIGAIAAALSRLHRSARPGTSTEANSRIAAFAGSKRPYRSCAEGTRTKAGRNVRSRITAANRRSSDEWRQISNRAQWEQFAKGKLQLLEASLGTFPSPSKKMAIHRSGTVPGDGFTIENLVFESRPGLWVTANLYSPEPVRERMPGILLCHSHHNPKTQGELQDMGMTWARQGYLVLVMDQLGHGERRQHPFRSAADYAGPFEVNRQDYHFRYNVGIQLQLIGDSLMGWMVWDLRRGVDLLLSRPGIDPGNIILMGAVAGGGDPAAVTAALDKRITAVVPFNFGGPQPEDPFPLLANPEESFNFAGNGSWESTRNLRLSCQDGFLPWVIVGAIAPRRLIYAHEFSWDQANDPVWKRLRKIYDEFYQAPDRLDYAQGYGVLKGRPPQASHCNNIGPPHRERIHAALSRWCQVPVSPADEYSNRRKPEELEALTPETARKIQPRPVHDIAAELGQERATAAWAQLEKLDSAQRISWLRSKWQSLLGSIVPGGKPRVVSISQTNEPGTTLRSERVLLETESGRCGPADHSERSPFQKTKTRSDWARSGR